MRKSLCNRLFAILLLVPLPAWAQLVVVKNHQPKARIVCVDGQEVNQEAATLLNTFIERISGATLPVEENGSYRKGDIIIGETTTLATEDGFELDCHGDRLNIRTGGGRGAIYGVATLLEKYLGVSYYTLESYDLTKSGTIVLPAISHHETPAFRYRQTQSYGNEDPIYKQWFRLKEPKEIFAANLWVHTFNRILPAAVYGKKHPEWYSLLNGKRQPGDHSQWCLTNEEVFEMACQKIDSIFKANPDMRTISVSQNDGNNTQCQCPACKAIDEYEGSPSGNLVRFMNKLATRFPDKEFSTLAYLYSMQPPKHTKPLKNVNIMLCDIDCRREVPLTDNASGQQFVKALTGWSAISDNIFIWDYCINFDNVVAPFPNFHILQKNLQLFKENHATMVFEQANGSLGTDFSELRAYMLAKLMWDPYQDSDSLMQAFLQGYYREAAPYLYQYQKLLQGALLASGIPLWIYDTPVSHKDGMLNANLRKLYNELFDQAEAAVATDSVRLRRVRIARLPLQYAELELARTNPDQDTEATRMLLNLFEQRTAEYQIPTLNERRNYPADYCRLYRERFLPTKTENKAALAPVTWINPPEEHYQEKARKALTDGLYGGTSYGESWVGWVGEDADFVIDLGQEQEISEIATDFLHHLGAWILLPKGGSYQVSTDGESYRDFGTFAFEEDRDIAVKFRWGRVVVSQPVRARYIKVHVDTLGNCPSWHYGVGYPAWFFLDEIIVR